jgi:hypothetical protein
MRDSQLPKLICEQKSLVVQHACRFTHGMTVRRQATGMPFLAISCMRENEMAAIKHGLWLVGIGSHQASTSLRLFPLCAHTAVCV